MQKKFNYFQAVMILLAAMGGFFPFTAALNSYMKWIIRPEGGFTSQNYADMASMACVPYIAFISLIGTLWLMAVGLTKYIDKLLCIGALVLFSFGSCTAPEIVDPTGSSQTLGPYEIIYVSYTDIVHLDLRKYVFDILYKGPNGNTVYQCSERTLVAKANDLVKAKTTYIEVHVNKQNVVVYLEGK